MKITVIQERTPALLAQLTAVWEASVKATHTFLSAGEREQIKGYVCPRPWVWESACSAPPWRTTA